MKLLYALILVAAFAEAISISALLPFLAVLDNPDRLFDSDLTKHLILAFEIKKSSDLVIPVTIVFCLLIIFANTIRLTLLWVQTRLAYAIGADISLEIYRRTLYQPYSVHVQRNSSELISGITAKTGGVVHGFVLPILSLLNSIVIVLAIMIALISIQPFAALTAFSGFGVLYIIIIRITRKGLAKNSARANAEQSRVIKALQEGMGGIRDILLNSAQENYCRTYQAADLPLRKAQANIQLISTSPRYVIEALGVVMIATIAVRLSLPGSQFGAVIPILATLALGAQRLLPIMQQAYSAWTSIKGVHDTLLDVRELLAQPYPIDICRSSKSINFCNEIRLNSIYFRYADSLPWILKGVNLSVKRGSKVGFFGVTGSGKSTFLDIFMALLEPTKGNIIIDNTPLTEVNRRSWYPHIAHVPQAIYLADTSIEENIAFGVSVADIDYQRVRNAAQRAQIDGTIESWVQGYKTIVGERGVRLSGGQRQRLAIARAFYKRADVIIFDEATSALDSGTESDVMDAINSLGDDVTLLIVAHRLSTLAVCDEVFEFSNGQATRVTDAFFSKLGDLR